VENIFQKYEKRFVIFYTTKIINESYKKKLLHWRWAIEHSGDIHVPMTRNLFLLWTCM